MYRRVSVRGPREQPLASGSTTQADGHSGCEREVDGSRTWAHGGGGTRRPPGYGRSAVTSRSWRVARGCGCCAVRGREHPTGALLVPTKERARKWGATAKERPHRDDPRVSRDTRQLMCTVPLRRARFEHGTPYVSRADAASFLRAQNAVVRGDRRASARFGRGISLTVQLEKEDPSRTGAPSGWSPRSSALLPHFWRIAHAEARRDGVPLLQIVASRPSPPPDPQCKKPRTPL